MNSVTIVGTVGRAGGLETSKDGRTQFLKFSVAVDVGYGENKAANWYSCVVFGKSAEYAFNLIEKGARVTVVGTQKLGNPYQDKAGKMTSVVEVNVDKFDVPRLSRRDDQASIADGLNYAAPAVTQQYANSKPHIPTLDSDIPF